MVGEEEVIFDLSENTTCPSFIDPTFQVVILYNITGNISQAKNPNKSFDIYLVDIGTSKEDSLENEEFVYVLKSTYLKSKQKYIHLENLEKCL